VILNPGEQHSLIDLMDDPRPLPKVTDFLPGTSFVIKEFNVPLVQVPGGAWFNWFGGRPRPYDVTALRVDNNWPAESFEEWVGIVAESLPSRPQGKIGQD
jgi:hypothetical protein